MGGSAADGEFVGAGVSSTPEDVGEFQGIDADLAAGLVATGSAGQVVSEAGGDAEGLGHCAVGVGNGDGEVAVAGTPLGADARCGTASCSLLLQPVRTNHPPNPRPRRINLAKACRSMQTISHDVHTIRSGNEGNRLPCYQSWQHEPVWAPEGSTNGAEPPDQFTDGCSCAPSVTSDDPASQGLVPMYNRGKELQL